jgi:hypothetical protein
VLLFGHEVFDVVDREANLVPYCAHESFEARTVAFAWLGFVFSAVLSLFGTFPRSDLRLVKPPRSSSSGHTIKD